MRRVLALALALLLLAGCSPSGSYVYSRAHVSAQPAPEDGESIGDRAALTDAISAMLQAGVQNDTLLLADYQGELESDLEDITAEMTEHFPYGAYAVSSLVCRQVSILSRVQLTVTVQYSRTAAELRAVAASPTEADLTLRITEMLRGFVSSRAFYLDGVAVDDALALAEKCWLENPASAVGLDGFSVARYPAEGEPYILELTVSYLDEPSALRAMAQDVRNAAAAVCGECAAEDAEGRLTFVYDYLRDNVFYDTEAMRVVSETGGRQPKTATYTAYGALLEGQAAQSGIALAAKALCDELGIEAQVLSGTLEGEPHLWLVVTLNGMRYHFDPSVRAEKEAEPAPEGGEDAPEEPEYLFSLTAGRRRFQWNKRLYGVY